MIFCRRGDLNAHLELQPDRLEIKIGSFNFILKENLEWNAL